MFKVRQGPSPSTSTVFKGEQASVKERSGHAQTRDSYRKAEGICTNHYNGKCVEANIYFTN